MSNLDIALSYARQGFSVIPTKENNVKEPVFQHSNRKPLTEDEIQRYWAINPNYGLALKMDKIFSIDIDTPKHAGTTKIDGFKSIEESIPEEWLPPTLTAITPSGGKHLYYMKTKDNFPNKSQAGILPGVDIQASINSISVVPPTIRSDGEYKWEQTGIIAEPPKELIEFLKEKLYPKGTRNTNFKPHIGRIKKYTGEVLDKLVAKQDKGTRNSYLTSLMGTMLYTGAEPETCYELLHFTNSRFNDPLPEKEVNTIYASILNKDMNNG